LPQKLAEGVYVVGSGNTGSAITMGIFGVAYMAIVAALTMSLKLPHASAVSEYESYVTQGPRKTDLSSLPGNVNHYVALKTD